MVNVLKKYSFFIFFSFLFSFFYFSIDIYMIGTGEFKGFFGDEVNLYIPQFYHLHESIRSGTFLIGDFFTANHSTEFSLRPNVPGFNLVYILSSIIKISSIKNLYYLFTFILFLYTVMSMFFAQLLAFKFFKLDKFYALFFAVLFTFSSQAFIAKGFAPFFFIHMSVPLLLYTVLNIRFLNTYQALLSSIVFIFVYLQGYLPLSVFSIIISLIFYYIYYYNIKTMNKYDNKRFNFKEIFLINKNIFMSLSTASLIILPYYLAILLFNKEASTVPTGIDMVVDYVGFHLKPYDILSFFSYGIFNLSKIETHTLYIGLISIFSIFSYFLLAYKVSTLHKKIIFVSILIFLSSLFISFGEFYSLSDIFYFYVPALGKMHLYSRYMLITHLFFALAVTVSFMYLLKNKNQYKNLIITFFFIMSFLFITINANNFLAINNFLTNINIELLNIEIITFLVFLLLLLRLNTKQMIFLAISIVFINNLTYKNYLVKGHKQDLSIIFNQSEMNQLVDFLHKNSDSKIIKYVNLFPEIHPYVPRNFPWYVENKIKLSNYYGYEPHLASYREYRDKFPYYGTIDFKYLFATGCEFIIANDDLIAKYGDFLNGRIDEYQIFPLSDGSKVYKLKKYNIDKYFARGKYKIEFMSNINNPINIQVGNSKYITNVNSELKHSVEVELKSEQEVFQFDLESSINKNIKVSNIFLFTNDIPITIDKIEFNEKFDREYTSELNNGWSRYFNLNGHITVFKQSSFVPSDSSYNDGFIYTSDKKNIEIKNFNTNYLNNINYELIVKKPIVIDFLFFNSKSYLANITSIGQKDSTKVYGNSIELLPGNYMLEFSYTNILYMIFLYFILVYIILFVIIVFKMSEKE